MNHTLLTFVFVLFTCATQAAERPNIVWIIPDDMSANFSCYGETAIETPNVDRLAARGVKFTQRLRHCTCLLNLPFGLHHRHVPDEYRGSSPPQRAWRRENPASRAYQSGPEVLSRRGVLYLDQWLANTKGPAR